MEVNENKNDPKIDLNPEKTTTSFYEAWSELKSSPRELYIVFFLKFLESYSYFAIIYTLIIFLSDEFKYSDEQAGWLYGLFGMCTSVYGFIFGGFLIDNLGVRLSLCLGCSILLLGRLLLVICSCHYHILLILYTVLPIGTCLGIPVMQIGIRRFTTEKARALAYSIFYAMMNVSAIFSASAIDFFRRNVADGATLIIFGMKFELTSYRALFLSGACTTFCSLLISFFFLKEADQHEVEKNESVLNESSSSDHLMNNDKNRSMHINQNSQNTLNTSLLSANKKENSNELSKKQKKIVGPFAIIKEVTSQKSFWKFVCLIMLLMGVRIVYRHLDATFPKYMIREFGKDVMYGSIIAINPFLIVILIPIFAPLSYQFSAYSQIAFGAFITAISPFFLAYGPYLWSSVMFVVILSIGEALWSPRLYEYTIFITEKGREGIYMALASSPMFIATLVTGATSGFFLETFCPEKGPKESWKMWLLIGLITFSSPILLFFFKNRIEVTDDELVKERKEKSDRKKKLEEEEKEKEKERERQRLSVTLHRRNSQKFDYNSLVISSSEMDLNFFKIEKQNNFSLEINNKRESTQHDDETHSLLKND
jgi:MFS family permease